MVIATIVAFVIALVGYDLIHKAEQYLTYATVVIVGIFTVVVLTLHYPAGIVRPRPASSGRRSLASSVWWPATRSAGPSTFPTTRATCRPNVTVRKTFYWTYWGSAIGGGWMMILGALLAGWAGDKFDGTGISEILSAGNKVFDGFGDIVLVLSASA